MAILLGEPEADACIALLESETDVLISAAVLPEARIVAGRRNVADELAMLIDDLGLNVSTVSPAVARRVAKAYEKWGKGAHSADLNFGDCFSYELAKEHRCGLLYVGDDFAKTDVEGVLGK